MLLKEKGIDLGQYQVKRMGAGGSIYYIWVDGSAIGHYDQLHHKISLYDFIE